MITRLAALPMYDLEEIRDATDAFFAGLARHLARRGVAGVPTTLERGRDLAEQWTDPALLFGQTCGYPLTRALSGKVRVVAAPRHHVPGCEDGEYFSVVVVAEPSAARALSDLRGARLAINDDASHSGKNALGALVAPLATDDAPFFGAVVVTGGHVESLAAIARGDADVAAIDCITHALLARHRPAAVAGTRIVAVTAHAPAPPYVTAASTSDDDLARIRAALEDAAADPSRELRAARDALLLGGVKIVDERDYARIGALEAAHVSKRVFG